MPLPNTGEQGSEALEALEILLQEADVRFRVCVELEDWQGANEAACIRQLYLRRIAALADGLLVTRVRQTLQRARDADTVIQQMLHSQRERLQQQMRKIRRGIGAGASYSQHRFG